MGRVQRFQFVKVPDEVMLKMIDLIEHIHHGRVLFDILKKLRIEDHESWQSGQVFDTCL